MNTLTKRPDVAAYALAALCVLAITVLGGLGQPIPDVLGLVATGAIGVGAAALPGRVSAPAREVPEPFTLPSPVRPAEGPQAPAAVPVLPDRLYGRETTPQTPIRPGEEP